MSSANERARHHDKNRALDRIEFLELLKHTGDFMGQPFRLLDWEYQFIWDVYGTVKENGYRAYKYAYLEVPKKNGKTELAAGLALSHLFLDAPGGEIYCCAAEKGQAALVYNAAKSMIEQAPSLKRRVKIIDSQKIIVNRATKTTLKVLSAEAYSKHGINPTVVIFDELHAQPNRDLWDVMTFGSGSARREPLFMVITTAGDDPDRNSIGWEKHEYAKKIIDGEIDDPIWYARIYAADDEDDIYDEEVWYRANPSLGISIPIETIREEAQSAKNSPANEKLFRWLRLNQWVALKQTSWLPLTLYDACVDAKFDITKLAKKTCYEGLDLSSVGDLTARALLFPPQRGLDKFVVIFRTYIPVENMKERERLDKVPFSRWVKDGYVQATAGDVVDYSYIMADIIKDSKMFNVREHGNDPWGAEKLRQDLLKLDNPIDMTTVPQNIAMFSPVMKEVERLMKIGEIVLLPNPVARWCFGNMKIYVDGNENYKPMKKDRRSRIDPWVALFDAMYLYSKQKVLAYDIRGVRAI